jgi:hypothetical protein
MRESTSTDPRLIASARKVLGLRQEHENFEVSIRRVRSRQH